MEWLRDILEAARRGWRQALDPTRQTETALFASVLLLAVAAALFGGASQGNALSLMAVELASLPLLSLSLYLTLAGAAPRGAAWPIGLLALIAILPLAQLAPLPASVWTSLPGRQTVTQALDVAHLGRPALPFSLAPEQTWRSWLALAPPAAMFLGALRLAEGERRTLAVVWLVVATVSVCIGGLQLLSGADSGFYFYAITNPDSAVGLFSNRNHQAALLYALVPFAALFAGRLRGLEDPRAIPPLLAALFVVVAIVGVAVTRSRAGLALMGLSLVGSAALLWRTGLAKRHWRATAGIGLGAVFAVGAVLLFGLGPILDRFGGGEDLRFEDWPVALGAAQGLLPFGAGVGAFDTVYESVEPLSQVTPIYFNHAHNDYLELWLETGMAGAALVAAFLAWFGARLVAVWRAAGRGADFAAACTLAVALLAAHEAVDYPLRTESLAVLFAFACAAVAAPSETPRGERRSRRRVRS